jgi:hypothetical protein
MARLKVREAYWRKRVQYLRRAEKRATKHSTKQTARVARRKAETALAKVRAQRKAAETPLRLRALAEAEKLIGVMEHGGNNMGPLVSQIIRENGGTGPEPWCGDFVAHCYRKAGSKMVSRPWAAVSYLGWLTGMKVLSTPVAGCIVIYTFSHTGLFARVAPPGIEAVEGNTGASGAVSDSSTGGDGVYRKRRSRTLVRRYVLPTR